MPGSGGTDALAKSTKKKIQINSFQIALGDFGAVRDVDKVHHRLDHLSQSICMAKSASLTTASAIK
jgi:hypothetical protein